jgi:alkylmercury lyase
VSSRPAPVAAEDLADQRLDALARTLAAVLPCTDRVSVGLLELLAAGQPVSRRDLAAALSATAPGGAAPRVTDAQAEAMVSAVLQRMPNVEFDVQGHIVGWGLTLAPTDHEIDFAGAGLYTWCAFDTVLFPLLLGRRAKVRSHCHATGVPIRCSVGPDRPEMVTPAGAMISLVVPDQVAGCCDVRGSFCQHVHFFASPAAASTWRTGHESGDLVSVAEAHAIARRIVTLHDLQAGGDSEVADSD